MNPPTLEELRSAWQAMRQRPGLRHWPAEFDQVMSDSVRATCVSLEAKAARRRPCKQQPVWIGIDRASRPDQTAYWTQPNPHPRPVRPQTRSRRRHRRLSPKHRFTNPPGAKTT